MFKINLKEIKHTGVLIVELRITKTNINLAQNWDKFLAFVNTGINFRIL